MSHKALCRQQRSECLLFLHSEKETTKEVVKSAGMPTGKVSHFSIAKKTKQTQQKRKFCFHASGLSRNIH